MAERLDKLHLDGYSILQDKKKFCYGIDAVLLADFALKNTKSRIKDFETNKDFLFIDLGTGNGIIPILLAAKTGPRVKIQGIERNRLKSGACVKLRGSVAEITAAMEAALKAAEPIAKIVSHTIIAAPSADSETAITMTIKK